MILGLYIYIGGDELFGILQVDFDFFVECVMVIVVEVGKVFVVWYEMGLVVVIVEGMIGQYWGKMMLEGIYVEEVVYFVECGGVFIMLVVNVMYFDMKYFDDFLFGLIWVGIIDVWMVYEWEFIVVFDVFEFVIFGVEVFLWLEMMCMFDEVEQLVFFCVVVQVEVVWFLCELLECGWELFWVCFGLLVLLWKVEGVDFYFVDEIFWSIC